MNDFEPNSELSYLTPYNVDLFSIKSQNLLEEYLRKIVLLPEPLKNLLMDTSTSDFVGNLSANQALSTEQHDELLRIIRDVLLADIFINDLGSEISKRLSLDPGRAQQIRDRIINELFAPVAADIRNIQREKFSDRLSQGGPSPASSTSTGPNVNANNIIDLRNKPQ